MSGDLWKEFDVTRTTTEALERILEGQAPMLLFGFISLIYRQYKVGVWEGRLPEPEEFDEE